MKISPADTKNIEDIAESFSSYLNAQDSNAVKKFMHNIGFFEKVSLGYLKLRHDFATESNKGLARIKHCDKAIPPLVRTFGEANVVAAMPHEKCTPEIIEICRSLGADNIVKLMNKAQEGVKYV